MGTTQRNNRCRKVAGQDGFCHLHRNQMNSDKEEFKSMEEKPANTLADIPRKLKVCL